MMTPQRQVAHALADAMLAGRATIEGFAERVMLALGRRSRWVRPLCRRTFELFGSGLCDAQRTRLIRFIHSDAGYRNAWNAANAPRIHHHFLDAPPMAPRRGALARCALPSLPTSGDVAAWLEITPAELDWYADPLGMIRCTEGPLCHYRYKWIAKRHGGLRLVEIPKPRLREIQRKILREILDPVPPHAAAHGFRRGHSCLSYALPHAGRLTLLRMDLQNFFVSIPAARINALFKTLGYPEAVARVLTGLCTHRILPAVFREITKLDSTLRLPWPQRKQYAESHLPQGVPTSPALANLCALHLDFRLAALADALGGAYTRYADDIAISADGRLRRRADRVSTLVAAIALEERFAVNHRKTRIMHRSGRQMLTGIVVNEKTNIPRHEYDSIKAILHNCVRFGPPSQNRAGHGDFRAHLAGRVSYVTRLNLQRGLKLQSLFERIDWGSAA